MPLDAAETVDTDGDGIGNNGDTDDDNDGLWSMLKMLSRLIQQRLLILIQMG